MVRSGRPSGQCSSDNVPARSPVVVGFNLNPAGWNLVDGHTYSSKARTIRIHFTRGSTLDVPVSGRFFVFELGPDHSSRSEDPPASLEVLDATGKALGTRVDPLRVHGRLKVASALAASVRLRAQLTLPGTAEHVALSSGRDSSGNACMRVLLNGHSMGASDRGAWQCNASIGRYDHVLDARNPKLVHRVPVSWTLGYTGSSTSGSHPFAYGYVGPAISRLQLRFQDGHTADVALSGRFFAYAVPVASYRPGHRPSVLHAYSSSGKLIYEQPLYPKRPCVYPGLDAACGQSSTSTSTFVAG
jgi:hypothetical protein